MCTPPQLEVLTVDNRAVAERAANHLTTALLVRNPDLTVSVVPSSGKRWSVAVFDPTGTSEHATLACCLSELLLLLARAH